MTEPVDLSKPSGPPLSTSQLAQAIGFSSEFVRLEIEAGELHAVKCGRGLLKHYRIPWPEARRYAAQMGLLSI